MLSPTASITCAYSFDTFGNTAACTYDLKTGALMSSFVGANCQASLPSTSVCLNDPN